LFPRRIFRWDRDQRFRKIKHRGIGQSIPQAR
jgi:hypothetical protein